jgi:tetratricopeptide (TPR) repeat protein
MSPELAQYLRVEKRLDEATGYLDLGMAQHALACLDRLGPLGPFESDVELLRCEALLHQGLPVEAGRHLAAAERCRLHRDAEALRALSLVHQQVGDLAHAVHTLAKSRGAMI